MTLGPGAFKRMWPFDHLHVPSKLGTCLIRHRESRGRHAHGAEGARVAPRPFDGQQLGRHCRITDTVVYMYFMLETFPCHQSIIDQLTPNLASGSTCHGLMTTRTNKAPVH